MTSRSPIYTIGYGSRSIDEFIALLRENAVTSLVDVRTSPYSSFRPEFSREPLASTLDVAGIRYIFLGKELGGKPNSPDCYVDGKVDYGRLREKDFYKRGISRLLEALDQRYRIALMCSEGRPEDCHRSKLIGVSLSEAGIPLVHLDEEGARLGQDEVIARLTGGQLDLFGSPAFTSRKKYGDNKS